MRALLSALVLSSLAACDSVGDEIEPYAGVVFVELTAAPSGQPNLRLTTDDGGCARGLFVDPESIEGGVRIDVLGLGPETSCDALIPASVVIAFEVQDPGPTAVEVAHAGAVDRYEASAGSGGLILVPVRTSTTRPR